MAEREFSAHFLEAVRDERWIGNFHQDRGIEAKTPQAVVPGLLIQALMRLRRGDCAHHLSSTDSEHVCQCDTPAPLLSPLLAFGPPYARDCGLPLRYGTTRMNRRRSSAPRPPRPRRLPLGARTLCPRGGAGFTLCHPQSSILTSPRIVHSKLNGCGTHMERIVSVHDLF